MFKIEKKYFRHTVYVHEISGVVNERGWISFRCQNPECRKPILFEWRNTPPKDVNVKCKFCNHVWEIVDQAK
jgi:hypothetical protein